MNWHQWILLLDSTMGSSVVGFCITSLLGVSILGLLLFILISITNNHLVKSVSSRVHLIVTWVFERVWLWVLWDNNLQIKEHLCEPCLRLYWTYRKSLRCSRKSYVRVIYAFNTFFQIIPNRTDWIVKFLKCFSSFRINQS